MKPSIYAILLMSVVLLFTSTNAIAQNEGRWYQVELLIFKRLDDTKNTGEIWQRNIELHYPYHTRPLPTVLPSSSHQLGGHNYTLRKSGDYNVLFHKAWEQQMWQSSQSPALIIRGGERYGNHRELEGTIKIHIGRYLHVTTDLWLSNYTAANEHNIVMELPPLPNSKDSSEFFVEEITPTSIITFREKRRMKSKETHYIDHPAMGILIRMLPLKK